MPPSSSLKPDKIDLDKFRKKSTAKDYVVYLSVLVVAAGLIGGGVYYFTRSEPEKEKLQAALSGKLEDAGLRDGKEAGEPPATVRKEPDLDGLLGEETEETAAPVPVKRTESKAVAVSVYSGGGPNRVMESADPKVPRASAEFIEYAEALRLSGVVPGKPAKVMIGGRMFRGGEVIDEGRGVTFAGVDAVKKVLILRDESGAELRLSY